MSDEILEKKQKDMKIPKLAPFKDELLQQAEEAKKQVRSIAVRLFSESLFAVFSAVGARTTGEETATCPRSPAAEERPSQVVGIDGERRRTAAECVRRRAHHRRE